MVAELFESLLQDVGKAFHLTLKPDANNSCLFRIPPGVSIQMEIDRKRDCFVIGADLGPIPVGKYRENLFQEALRANGMPPPQYGIFAYSRQNDHFILHTLIPVKEITGERLVEYLPHFAEKAWNWKNAIDRGEIPQVVDTSAEAKAPFGIFGVKP